MGSQGEVGKLETDLGKKPGVQYTGGWYTYSQKSAGGSFWLPEKSVSKGYPGMIQLKKIMFYSLLFTY